ncbi:DNA internalization-related competence protein ComEC/Rec2 [Candidatus Sumerlaeota bacterium]|nr:DNA internalization-related competence protein ComEC/Rec2 [Candidatus Sumerlaeota bacterium]
MRHPLLIVTTVLICGMITGQFVYLPPLAVFLANAAVLVICAFEIIRHQLKRGPRPQGTLLFIVVFFVGLYLQNQLAVRQVRASERLALLEQGGNSIISGRLTDDPELRDGFGFLEIDRIQIRQGAMKCEIPGKLLIRLQGSAFSQLAADPPAWHDWIEARGVVRRNTGGRNPGPPDYFDFLLSNDIHGWIVARSSNDIRLVEEKHRSPLAWARHAAQGWKDHFSEIIARRMPGESAAIMQSICFGRAYRLGPDLRRDFMKTGLMHVFAVSGLHVGILGLICFFTFRFLRAGPRLAAVLTLIVLLGYMLMVGPRPPVVRAVIMAASLTLSLFIKTRVDHLSSLSLAALLILLWEPQQLQQTGFQLSFLAVAGILFFTKPIYGLLCWKPPEDETLWHSRVRRVWNHCVPGVLAASLGVQLMVAPVIAVRFHYLPLLALLLNAAIYPLVVVIMGFGALILLTSTLSPGLAGIAATCGEFFCRIMALVVRHGADWPLAYSEQPTWPWWAVAAYYLMILAPLTVRRIEIDQRMPFDRPKQNAVLLMQFIGLVCFAVWMPLFSHPPRDITITFFDVGQGDSALIEFPAGRTALIDAGPPSAARRALLPYFEAHGIRRLDLVIATHDDLDHYGGLIELAREIPISQLLIPQDPTLSEKFQRMLDDAHARGAQIHAICAPASIPDFCAAEFEFLNPADNPVENSFRDDNDLSLVTRVTYFDRTFLFTGDLTFESEADLLERRWDVGADVLKTSHHGSKHGSSPAFLRAVHPAYAVISCGRDNRFGHPAQEVLQRLRAVNARIYRTDRQGAVVIHTDGKYLQIESHQQEAMLHETNSALSRVDAVARGLRSAASHSN